MTLLSILIPGKNDNFRENCEKVLNFNLNKTISNLNNLGLTDVEIVLCDWGSEKKIIENLPIRKYQNFKCVYVPPDIAKKYNGEANYSIVHPINTAFRHSIGKYVVFWDSDCYVPQTTIQNLYQFIQNMETNNDMSFYWASKWNISYDTYMSFNTYHELDNYLESNDATSRQIINTANFGGDGIAMLMNRELWQDSTGFWEILIYWGWQDIEFHDRLKTKYNFGGDLENYNMKFYHLFEPINNKASNKLTSPLARSENFQANDESWGLNNEKLEIIKFI